MIHSNSAGISISRDPGIPARPLIRGRVPHIPPSIGPAVHLSSVPCRRGGVERHVSGASCPCRSLEPPAERPPDAQAGSNNRRGKGIHLAAQRPVLEGPPLPSCVPPPRAPPGSAGPHQGWRHNILGAGGFCIKGLSSRAFVYGRNPQEESHRSPSRWLGRGNNHPWRRKRVLQRRI
jgi:hypothetical protein